MLLWTKKYNIKYNIKSIYMSLYIKYIIFILYLAHPIIKILNQNGTREVHSFLSFVLLSYFD